jgi:hypothetical protein
MPFGYKIGWIAVKGGNPGDLAQQLNLEHARRVPWTEGIEAAYRDRALQPTTAFVTPPVGDWVLAVGSCFLPGGGKRSLDSLANLVTSLSVAFGEAQSFATHRVVEYHHWMRARDGHLERYFAFIGEGGEVIANIGPVTEAERKLRFSREPVEQWMPNQEDVMTMAGAWSIDPSKLTALSIPAGLGILGRIPKEAISHPSRRP